MPKKEEKTLKIAAKKKTFKEILEEGICTNHEGKMKGIHSISTSCIENPLCIANRKVEGSICQHCYAKTLQEMRTALHEKDKRNAEYYTKELIKEEDLPETNAKLFRLEAFGDLHNRTHLENYLAIVNHNPETRFTIYTKNYGLIKEYFSDHKCPDNMTVVISSLFLNRKMNVEPFYRLGAFKEGQLKVFTVYDYEFLREHPEIKINCGSRSCMHCKRCYAENNTIEVNEILKKDQRKSETMIELRDPEKVSSLLDSIDALLG